MAIAGATIVVGARYDDDDGSGSGSVYVFRTTDGGATYGLVAKLTAVDGAAYDNFGISVAIAGGTVVVGAEGDDDGFSMSGSAYVFAHPEPTDYAETAKAGRPGRRGDDRFGVSGGHRRQHRRGRASGRRTSATSSSRPTAAPRTAGGQADRLRRRGGRRRLLRGDDGGTIVVGSRPNTGAVYVFRTTDGGATYGQVAKLTAGDAAADDNFRLISVAIDGDTVVVGAYDDDDAGSDSGAAYVFRTSDGGATYTQVAKLTAADAAGTTTSATAIAGDTIVVGADDDDAAPVRRGLCLPHDRRRRHVRVRWPS